MAAHDTPGASYPDCKPPGAGLSHGRVRVAWEARGVAPAAAGFLPSHLIMREFAGEDDGDVLGDHRVQCR